MDLKFDILITLILPSIGATLVGGIHPSQKPARTETLNPVDSSMRLENLVVF